ncbi:cation transporter [Marinobacter sp.]|uniref:cation transporter n=1 Tax=Marinobacter sp. TaxID=50741 RepID=UPI003568A72F
MSEPGSGECGCKSVNTGSPTPAAPVTSGEWVSLYRIPKMDCPSEERMIRMALDSCAQIGGLSFDLENRQLRVLHDGEAQPVTDRLLPLGLGATLQETRAADPDAIEAATLAATRAGEESGTLKILLAINAVMFVLELTSGVIAQSTALIADSLDMFADAAVYGLSLYAVAHSLRMQVRAAHFAGVLQLILALGVLLEVGRRFLLGSEPESALMMVMALIALVANSTCLILISRHRHSGAHMKASWIFSANDVIINLGVIVAGVLVAWTGSNYPDLVVGTIVGLIVLDGARRILALKS